MNPNQFAQTIKAKYPEYANVDDLTLAQKMVAKYPEYASKVNFGTPEKAPSTLPVTPTLTGADNPVGSLPVIKQLTQVGTGIGSAIGKSGLNLGKAVLEASQGVADLGTKYLGTQKVDYSPEIAGIDSFKKKVFEEPVNTELNTFGGKTGEFIGTVAPYVATGGTTSALSNAATAGIKGAGFLPAAARVAAGAATEGAANYGIGYGLSGGDKKQAAIQGITAGVLKGVTGTIGEVTNASKLPQRIMQSTYKTDKNTVAKIFGETDTAAEGSTQPLSKWAVDKGLKGSLTDQAQQVKNILNDSEDKVIASAAAAKKTIPVEPNLVDFAQSIKNDYAKVGRGEISKGAEDFLNAIKEDGTASVKDTIYFKRLLTNVLRSKASFTNPNLADNATYWSNDLIKQINSIDDLGSINKDYSLAMKAREALIKAATAAGNHKALGALEAYAIEGGILAHEPLTGLGTVIAKRTLQSPNFTSRVAQGLVNLPKSSPTGSAARTLLGAGLGKLTQ